MLTEPLKCSKGEPERPQVNSLVGGKDATEVLPHVQRKEGGIRRSREMKRGSVEVRR